MAESQLVEDLEIGFEISEGEAGCVSAVATTAS